jgi:hypothetical protein
MTTCAACLEPGHRLRPLVVDGQRHPVCAGLGLFDLRLNRAARKGEMRRNKLPAGIKTPWLGNGRALRAERSAAEPERPALVVGVPQAPAEAARQGQASQGEAQARGPEAGVGPRGRADAVARPLGGSPPATGR